jgi:predicted nucleotidyltransferase
VEILGKFCDFLCFGCETGSEEILMHTASALLSEEFKPLLHAQLDKGLSFPAARAAALENMGLDAEILRRPNDILAVEYCKAILATGTAMKPLPILREGSYHAETPDSENPSATALRKLIHAEEDWQQYVPAVARSVFENVSIHSTEAGERAVLAKLRTMSDAEFEALPYGSEGLWRKFMHESRKEATVSAITAATKSKRYTATRIDRMLICAFLGITAQMLDSPAPYVRALALNDRGRTVLKQARQKLPVINAGEAVDDAYFALERRCADLYGLFAATTEAPGSEEKQRIYYHKELP